MNTGSETQIEAYGAGQLSRCPPCFFIASKSVHCSTLATFSVLPSQMSNIQQAEHCICQKRIESARCWG